MKNKIIIGLLTFILLVSVGFNFSQYRDNQRSKELINNKQEIIVKAEFRIALLNARNLELMQNNKVIRDSKELYKKAYITEVKKYQ